MIDHYNLTLPCNFPVTYLSSSANCAFSLKTVWRIYLPSRLNPFTVNVSTKTYPSDGYAYKPSTQSSPKTLIFLLFIDATLFANWSEAEWPYSLITCLFFLAPSTYPSPPKRPKNPPKKSKPSTLPYFFLQLWNS